MLFKTAVIRLSFPAIMFIIGCSGTTGVDNQIEAPVPVEKSSDTAAFERGIRAWPLPESDSSGIRLEWHDIESTPVGGYIIYRGQNIDSTKNVTDLLKIATVETGQTFEDTAFIDANVRPGTTYYYKIAAFERSGSRAEGKRSETLEFTLGSSLKLLTPKNGAVVTDSIPVFRWSVADGGSGYSIIRIYEVNPVNNALRAPVWIYAGYPSFSNPFFKFNADEKALPLQKGKTYRWNITQIIPDRKNYGSVSQFYNFIVQ